MIGHAHIDPVWLGRWSEGVAVVHSTFQRLLDHRAKVATNPDSFGHASTLPQIIKRYKRSQSP